MSVFEYEDRPVIEDRSGGPKFTWNEYAAVLAEKLSLPIKFRYVKNIYDPPVERRIDKVTLKESLDGDLLIVGGDPDRFGDTRSFRVDRITDYIAVG